MKQIYVLLLANIGTNYVLASNLLESPSISRHFIHVDTEAANILVELGNTSPPVGHACIQAASYSPQDDNSHLPSKILGKRKCGKSLQQPLKKKRLSKEETQMVVEEVAKFILENNELSQGKAKIITNLGLNERVVDYLKTINLADKFGPTIYTKGIQLAKSQFTETLKARQEAKKAERIELDNAKKERVRDNLEHLLQQGSLFKTEHFSNVNELYEAIYDYISKNNMITYNPDGKRLKGIQKAINIVNGKFGLALPKTFSHYISTHYRDEFPEKFLTYKTNS